MHEIDLAASAEDRSRFFWWLAEWYENPPSRDQLSGLGTTDVTPDTSDALEMAWQELARAWPDPAVADVDDLGVEFTRLFGGVLEGMGPPPPFESVWRENRLLGESTLEVIENYRRAGFADIAPEVGPQDHIAAELKFIAMLALREAEAWRSGNPAGAETRRMQQREFLDRHLAAWVYRWAETIMRESKIPFFAALAGLLKVVLARTAQELSESIDVIYSSA